MNTLQLAGGYELGPRKDTLRNYFKHRNVRNSTTPTNPKPRSRLMTSFAFAFATFGFLALFQDFLTFRCQVGTTVLQLDPEQLRKNCRARLLCELEILFDLVVLASLFPSSPPNPSTASFPRDAAPLLRPRFPSFLRPHPGRSSVFSISL